MTTRTVPAVNSLIAAAVEKDRARRHARIVRALAFQAVTLLMMFLGGWALMCAVGNVHHDWITTCPTIGYGPAVLLTVLLTAVVRAVRLAVIPIKETS